MAMEIRRVNAHIQPTVNMTQLQIVPGLVAGYSTVKAPTEQRGKIAIQSKLDYLWRMERESPAPAPQSPKASRSPPRPRHDRECRIRMPVLAALCFVSDPDRVNEPAPEPNLS
ncbi:uncharacterized protein FTOL_03341 [Fusarium torulosum]|uniref:Uncharacterized protein n=1 Tax=Fusarium torulosum TaxID=33205 RepID=A0AAE8M3E1_9HYPO|nr:uncharacterized protein FTOL_03341 [Fusarium torulosum]